MIYSFIDGAGPTVAVKNCYRLAGALWRVGAPCCPVTADGKAPAWFRASVPTIAEAEAANRAGPSDAVLFSSPGDCARLRSLPGRLALHCQLLDASVWPILEDDDIALLTCSQRDADAARERAARQPLMVGVSVADCFFPDGALKRPGTVACAEPVDGDLVAACRAAVPHLEFFPAAAATEAGTALALKSAEYYLAATDGAWCGGLPVLEAMAAGCVVLLPAAEGAPPLLPGAGLTHLVAPPGSLPGLLQRLAAPAGLDERARLRDRAVAAAGWFRPWLQTERLQRLCAGPLAWLRA